MKTTLKSFLYFLTGSISFALLISITACKEGKGTYFIIQAEAEQKNRNYDKAKEYCTEAIKLDSNDILAYKKRAIEEMLLSDDQGALKDLDKIVKLTPKHGAAYIDRGDARCLLKDTLGAIEDYKKAIELDSSISYVYGRLGDIELNKKDSGSAMDFFNKSIKYDTNDAWAYYEIAWIEFGRRAYKAAASDFERSIKIDLLASKTLYLSSAFQGLGITEEWLNDTLSALTSFDQAIRYGIPFRNQANYYYRSQVKLRLKDTIGALEDCNEAIKIDSTYSYAYKTRGYIEYLKHDYKKAINDYTIGINFMPDKWAYYRRGLNYIESGEKKSGCVDLYKAKEMGDERADSVIKIHCK